MTTESETTKKTVLVVEDDDAMRAALCTKLEQAGFDVHQAENGVSGVIKAFERHPDIILLDILMPSMDGWEMLKEIRGKDDWGKCVPVVVLTNLTADEDVQIKRIAELGPSFFMTKADWHVEGVVGKVQEILENPKVCS